MFSRRVAERSDGLAHLLSMSPKASQCHRVDVVIPLVLGGGAGTPTALDNVAQLTLFHRLTASRPRADNPRPPVHQRLLRPPRVERVPPLIRLSPSPRSSGAEQIAQQAAAGVQHIFTGPASTTSPKARSTLRRRVIPARLRHRGRRVMSGAQTSFVTLATRPRCHDGATVGGRRLLLLATPWAMLL